MISEDKSKPHWLFLGMTTFTVALLFHILSTDEYTTHYFWPLFCIAIALPRLGLSLLSTVGIKSNWEFKKLLPAMALLGTAGSIFSGLASVLLLLKISVGIGTAAITSFAIGFLIISHYEKK